MDDGADAVVTAATMATHGGLALGKPVILFNQTFNNQNSTFTGRAATTRIT